MHSGVSRVDGRLDFAVFRNGSEIGRGAYRFTGDAAHREVAIDVNIEVKIAFVTVYRFTHRARELWDGLRLARMDADTNDNGKKRTVHVARNGDGLTIAVDGKTRTAPLDAKPLSFWNRSILTAADVIDPVDGAVFGLAVRREPGPRETYDIRYEADLRRQVTYDASGVLSAFRLWAHDGSELDYRLVAKAPAR